MVKGKAAYLVLGVVFITALLLRIYSLGSSWLKPESVKQVEQIATSSQVEVIDNQDFILEGESVVATSSEDVPMTFNEDLRLARLEEPQANSVVSSPLVVKGEAPGPWFFESSFPVRITDSDGNQIAIVAASAESDALTENFVPFKALLEFTTTATSGYIVLNNDNPSGLPENSLSVKIPVLFLNK